MALYIMWLKVRELLYSFIPLMKYKVCHAHSTLEILKPPLTRV